MNTPRVTSFKIMKNRIASFFLLPALLIPAFCDGQDAALLAAEKARGILTGNSGVGWTVNVTSSNGKSAKFRSASQGGKIFAEILEPADAAGRRYIAEADGKMWFWKPGLNSAVSVSKRQRLSGDAAIGDIASTSFVEGYKVEGSEDGTVDGEAATVYTMKAKGLGDTYKTIKYWVTKKGNLGKKAEFFAKSGTMVRSSTMEYNNSVNGSPFLSRMIIKDGGRTVDLKFSSVKLEKFPDKLFDRKELRP